MPELPEVETTLRGIQPHLDGRRIRRWIVRQPRLRQVITPDMPEQVAGQLICSLQRRSKYLLIGLERGSLLVHLGMSGSLRMVTAASPPRPHDHLDLLLDDGGCLRFHDPRRFGTFIWITHPPEQALRMHPLLKDLGPEPLGPDFSGELLYRRSRTRRVAIKAFIMDQRVVVGVGNIYANEALFQVGLHPARTCASLTLTECETLAATIRVLLAAAIAQGGTTLRDFVNEAGQPGYFAQQLQVYGRTAEPCPRCGQPIQSQRIGQRSSFYCLSCQPPARN